MFGRGADTATAHDMALNLLDGAVMRQAAMLAYNHVFLLVASIFLLTLPLIFLLNVKEQHAVKKTSPDNKQEEL
jgi:hypothetical protein